MITLVIWSFTLAMIPLTLGIACNATTALARSLTTRLEAEVIELH